MTPSPTPRKNNQRLIDKLPEIALSALFREVVQKISETVFPTDD